MVAAWYRQVMGQDVSLTGAVWDGRSRWPVSFASQQYGEYRGDGPLGVSSWMVSKSRRAFWASGTCRIARWALGWCRGGKLAAVTHVPCGFYPQVPGLASADA